MKNKESETKKPDREETEPLTGRSADEMARTMCPSIPWAAGLPLKAEGYECRSYRKE